MYAYVANNPVMYNDPSGLAAKSIAKWAVVWDYNENANGWSIAWQIWGWLIPIAWQVADIRDFSYQRDHGTKLDIAMAWIWFVPLLWDGIKSWYKAFKWWSKVVNWSEKVLEVEKQLEKVNDISKVWQVEKNLDFIPETNFVDIRKNMEEWINEWTLKKNIWGWFSWYFDDAKKADKTATNVAGKSWDWISKYKSFTKSNYGDNFDIYYWKWPFYLANGTKIQNLAKHHVFPQAFEKDFAKYWINVHEPKYIVPVDNLRWLEDNHSSFSRAYTQIWTDFFKKAYKEKWSSKTVKSESEKVARNFANDYNYLYPYN